MVPRPGPVRVSNSRVGDEALSVAVGSGATWRRRFGEPCRRWSRRPVCCPRSVGQRRVLGSGSGLAPAAGRRLRRRGGTTSRCRSHRTRRIGQDACRRIVTPGANRSRHTPKLESSVRRRRHRSPTVITASILAGDLRQALSPSWSLPPFPAAATTVTPSSITRRTAASNEVLGGPPRLMLSTAGAPAGCWPTIQSSPAMMSKSYAAPAQSKTRIRTIVTALATPCVVPASVPVTWYRVRCSRSWCRSPRRTCPAGPVR